MINTIIDIDNAETSALRGLYRESCADRGIDCRRICKMGRQELLRKIGILVKSGDIVERGASHAPAPVTAETPTADTGASPIRYPLRQDVGECLHLLLEAVRLYMMRDVWVSQGRKDDPQTRKYLTDAQECVRRAVGIAVGIDGEGWDKASKVAYYIDRALLRMRLDFNETLASTCVMCALLSDKHVVEMAKAAQ